jgi:putative transposase
VQTGVPLEDPPAFVAHHAPMRRFTYPAGDGHSALRRGRADVVQQIYHVTVTTRGRNPVFAGYEAACAASRAFETPAFLGDAHLLAWVLMPDHAHWLLQLGACDSLVTVVARLKSASARYTNRSLRTQGSLWSRAFHDHALRRDEDVVATARYIIANPVRAGLVERMGDYPFWNTAWL